MLERQPDGDELAARVAQLHLVAGADPVRRHVDDAPVHVHGAGGGGGGTARPPLPGPGGASLKKTFGPLPAGTACTPARCSAPSVRPAASWGGGSRCAGSA